MIDVIELSIIVPIYNGNESIEALIDSIEFYNKGINDIIEILLIDDESTDNSLGCCEVLSKKYSNIRVFTKQHSGVGETRNYGLKVAKGKYITFCDQDDEVIKSYESFINKINMSHADILISNYSIIQNGNIRYTDKISVERICEQEIVRDMTKRLFNIPSIIGELNYSHIPLFYPSIWNCIFLTDTIRKNGIEIGSFIEYDDDWKLLTEVMSVSNRVYLCTDSYYRWTHSFDSQSHTGRYIPEFTLLRKELKDYCIKKMQSLLINDDEIDAVLAFYDKETILKAYMNYKSCSFQDFKEKIKTISIDSSMKNKKKMLSKSTFKEKIWLLLFFSRLHRLSWLIFRIKEERTNPIVANK